jgi:hypothetical protein
MGPVVQPAAAIIERSVSERDIAEGHTTETNSGKTYHIADADLQTAADPLVHRIVQNGGDLLVFPSTSPHDIIMPKQRNKRTVLIFHSLVASAC